MRKRKLPYHLAHTIFLIAVLRPVSRAIKWQNADMIIIVGNLTIGQLSESQKFHSCEMSWCLCSNNILKPCFASVDPFFNLVKRKLISV